MFGRLIGKIDSFVRTALLSRSNQIEGADNKKKIFIPSTSFFDVLTRPENIFIDKSLLIKELLSTGNEAYLFTRPRRWGKTLNMNMIEDFFQADVDEITGEPNFTTQTKKEMFENLNIKEAELTFNPITGEKIKSKLIDFQGNFPVIKMTFEDIDPKSKSELIRKFAGSLKPVFIKHSYILKTKKKIILSDEYEIMDAFMSRKLSEITEEEVIDSLKHLISALHEHYGRRVVLLIDEYDQTLNNLIVTKSEYYQDALKLIKHLLNPIKNNDKLLLTVFAGATRLTKAGIFTGLNNFHHDSVVRSSFSEYFGFSENDVDFLVKNLIILNPKLSGEEVKASVTKWYNGYTIGNKTVYNPYSIMNCLYSLQKDIEFPYIPYWQNSSSNDFIKEAVLKAPSTEKIEELIIFGQIEFAYDDSFLLEEIMTDEVQLLTLLLHSGYITKVKDDIYKIPNLEVKTYFFGKILPSLLDKRYPDENTDLLLATFENVQEYGKAFQQETIDKRRYLKYNEYYFQTMTIAPFIKLNRKGVKYDIKIEQLTNEGNKIDVLLTPLKKFQDSVYILELKRTDFSGSKNRFIKDALIQVFSKNYINYVLKNAELPENSHWKNFHIRAIVFSQNKKIEKWFITIKELKFDLENLKKACKIYADKKDNIDKKDEILDYILPTAISVSEYTSEVQEIDNIVF